MHISTLIPPGWLGSAGVGGLLATFGIFMLPWGPGAPAGIIIARRDGLAPVLTITLYILSDVVTAFILEPVLRWLRERGLRSRFGQRIFEVVHRLAHQFQFSSGRVGSPLSLVLFTFATDFFTAGLVSLGLPLNRIMAWLAIITGDVSWFLIIFAATYGLVRFISDDRILFLGTMAIGFILPPLIRRLIGLFLAKPPANNDRI